MLYIDCHLYFSLNISGARVDGLNSLGVIGRNLSLSRITIEYLLKLIHCLIKKENSYQVFVDFFKCFGLCAIINSFVGKI